MNQGVGSLGRRIVAEVSCDGNRFPWHEERGLRFYDELEEPMLGLKGQPMSFGYNQRTNNVDFVFYEGADLKKVMMFKLAWGK